ncbi:carbohydrate ABC transporter permease [Marinithermus hydrothermalis]|uniref:ABC-type transporter, integral membrane subunit n=1 Tax=Marinithermus hydrothermalis (strain DSM 14884 / JCM 11576 / T1) TaxID=869210 RepID=F2NPV2_MARHT|nr:sugar ABC transporter permease [Marinithermus hydrothermalis]AEB12878.1 ABC-type transporter, integral membrane subunit [Marinithermus hydrothermalis DSM 14884]
MRRKWAPVLLILPSAVLLLVFVYGFIAWTAWLSTTNFNDLFVRELKPVGLANYLRLFEHPRFQIDLKNTLTFSLIFIPGCLGLGLAGALLLNSGVRFEGVWRTVFLMPMALSFIVTGVVWRWMMNPSTGLNLLFERLGLGFLANGWYTDPAIGIKAVALAAVWQLSGYTMALYLAGLRAIPRELYEAAEVDGASGWEAFRRITLPLLTPVTLSAIIILGHISLKIFDLVVAIAGSNGGPGFSSDVPAVFMFQTTFQANRFADGSAISIVLLILVSFLVIPYLRWSLRQEVRE